MNDDAPRDDQRWPRSVYGVGSEPDPRFSVANERTFLAGIRTSLGFLPGHATADRRAGRGGPARHHRRRSAVAVALEPTLPAERTRLAWQRTVLAAVVCLLAVLRLLAEVSIPLVAAVGIVLLLGTVLPVAASIRRSVRGREMTTDTGVGRNAAMLTALVSVACLGSIAYVLLA